MKGLTELKRWGFYIGFGYVRSLNKSFWEESNESFHEIECNLFTLVSHEFAMSIDWQINIVNKFREKKQPRTSGFTGILRIVTMDRIGWKQSYILKTIIYF